MVELVEPESAVADEMYDKVDPLAGVKHRRGQIGLVYTSDIR
jgi:hypothetical protein